MTSVPEFKLEAEYGHNSRRLVILSKVRWLVKIHLQSLCQVIYFFQCAYLKIRVQFITFPNVFFLGSCRDAAPTVGGAGAPIALLPAKPRPAKPRPAPAKHRPTADSGPGSEKTPLATRRSWVG